MVNYTHSLIYRKEVLSLMEPLNILCSSTDGFVIMDKQLL